LLFHDEHDESLAFLFSRMNWYEHVPENERMPEPVGVFYSIEDDCYEDLLTRQVEDAVALHGEADLEALLNAGDTYVIES
jgi:hypothetical protein